MIKCNQYLLQKILTEKIITRSIKTSIFCNLQKLPEKSQSRGPPDIPEEFKLVYKFPFIRYFGLINRLKIYQTALTATAIPGTSLMYQLEYLDFEVLKAINILGISGCCTMYGIGFLTSNFIGHIYYNDKKNLARIAYVDHWGRRRDLELPIEDIIPLDDLPTSRWFYLWMKFRRYSSNDTLKINSSHAASIVDEEGFKKVL